MGELLKNQYDKGELFSVNYMKGPQIYAKVGKEILDAGMKLQTGYETALMLSNPKFQDVKNILKDTLWIYQVNFWLPHQDKNSGVYSVHDSEALGRNMKFNQEELEEKLRNSETFLKIKFNPDTGVAFAPRNAIKLGMQKNWEEFSRNGLVMANYLPEGAEKLAQLAKNNFKSTHVQGVINNEGIEKRVSALGKIVEYLIDNLDVGAYYHGDSVDGYAFGILRNFVGGF